MPKILKPTNLSLCGCAFSAVYGGIISRNHAVIGKSNCADLKGINVGDVLHAMVSFLNDKDGKLL